MRDKIESAMVILEERFPLFAAHLKSLNIVKSEDVGSLATDGKELLYSEDYVGSHDPENLVFGLAHTACVLSFDYINRKGDRDNLYWSIAATLVISRFLEEQGMVIPEHVFLPVTIDDDEDIVAVYNRIIDGPVREMIDDKLSGGLTDEEASAIRGKFMERILTVGPHVCVEDEALPWKA